MKRDSADQMKAGGRRPLKVLLLLAAGACLIVLLAKSCSGPGVDESGPESSAETISGAAGGSEDILSGQEGTEELTESAAGTDSVSSGAEVLPPGAESGAEGIPGGEESGAESMPGAAESAEEIPRGDEITSELVVFNRTWPYASYSKINSGIIRLYRAAAPAKGKVVCVNAGHGTSGGASVKTQCHPDGTPKVTGGSTGAGETEATAVAVGTTLLDGTPEADVTLSLALLVRDRLLADGYDVLMIRETNDVQLDNIARTVLANQMADCHIALHYDSTENDKGAYYMSVPNIDSYRAMEPVASHYEEHGRLGESLIAGLREKGARIFEGGPVAQDLTQTSYSTVPSIDLEVGDRGSQHTPEVQGVIADGVVRGVEIFFGQGDGNS